MKESFCQISMLKQIMTAQRAYCMCYVLCSLSGFVETNASASLVIKGSAIPIKATLNALPCPPTYLTWDKEGWVGVVGLGCGGVGLELFPRRGYPL